MLLLRGASALLLWSFLCCTVAIPFYGRFGADEVIVSDVIEKIHNLIYNIEEIQIFELASAPTFFPIGRDFFELIDFMHSINVNRYTIQDIRDYAFKEVRAIHKLIYDHEMKISEFVDLLANTAFHVREEEINRSEKLVCDLRGIEDASAALIIDVWGIIVRIEALAEEFAYRVDEAIIDVNVADPSVLDEIRERATTLGQAYVEKYGLFADLMERVQMSFGEMLPALGNYVVYIKEA